MAGYGQLSEVNNLCTECVSISPSTEHGQKKVLADAAQEKQEGIQGRWQQESPFKEVLEHVKGEFGCRLQCSNDASCVQCGGVGQLGKLQRGMQERRKAVWMDCKRLQEAYDKVAMEDIGCPSIAQVTLRRNTDFLRRIIAPVSGVGSVTLSCVCPHCSCFPLADQIRWVPCGHGDGTNRKEKQCSWWCAAGGGQYEWRAPTRIWVVQIGVDADRAKVFKAHTAPMGLCDNLINTLKLLAKQ